jgi:tetratricopeptide (TPR) repeat protein
MALLHLVSGNSSSAASYFNQAFTQFDDLRATMGLAVALADAGQLDQAVNQCSLYLKRLMGGNPAPKLTEMLLASTLKTMGRFRAAASVYAQTIRRFAVDRDTARMYMELAFCYRSLGESTREADCIQKALEIAPDLAAEPARQEETPTSTRAPML